MTSFQNLWIFSLTLVAFVTMDHYLLAQESEGLRDEEIELERELDDDFSDLRLFDEEIPVDDVVERTIVRDRAVLEYAEITQADIFWQKFLWGVIDTREKINLPFASPQSPLFKLMLEGIQDGKVRAYMSDNFKDEMTEDQIQQLIFDVDTTFVTNPETYEQEMQIVQNEINSNNIKKFRIKEVWYFDKLSSRMRVKILGIAPIIDEVSKETDVTYSYPMFWIYWPHARRFFASQKVYTQGNDASTLSWDDYLEMRFFNYYIIKESNARDQNLSDYPSLAGDDELSKRRRLIKSKTIKDQIFNFEQDLWSY